MLVEGGGATTLGMFDVVVLVVIVTVVAIEFPPPPLLLAVQTLLIQSNPSEQSLTLLHVAPVGIESIRGESIEKYIKWREYLRNALARDMLWSGWLVLEV